MTRGTLQKKLLRDMRQSAMQFFSIVILCALGTFIFAGLDGIANLAQGTIDTYFEQNNLADFWITVPNANRDLLVKARGVPGVEDVCARASIKLEAGLPGDPTLLVTAYDGPMEINRPIVCAGTELLQNDLRGCLMQAGFAQAHGLTVGDRVSVEMDGTEYGFFIRGIVYSPEFICVTEGNYPNPQEYGYILIRAAAMPGLPLSEMLVSVTPGADAAQVKRDLQAALPGALILDRAAHQSTASATSNAEMFHKLLLVFPIIAYAVAALIVMTTLTRMIENQRLQIGTLKALGYSSGAVRRHYLAYAIWPSLLGSLAGIVIGHQTLPRLIWKLLLGQNEYPYRIYPRVSLASWGMAALTVVMSVGICAYTYQKSGRETTAELLRPKAPKAGRRILLERITPLWRRLSFNAKMVVRSLFRSRMRSFLSFVGILCCNSLIIASFGLQDSVNALAQNHYTQTLAYDVRANLTREAGRPESYRRLSADRVECVMETSADVQTQKESRTTLLTVVEDGQTLLRLGKDSTHVPIQPGGVAITEKLSDTLKTGLGESLEIRLPGEKRTVRLPITQIVYNNVQQGVYMARATWEGLRKGSFTPTAVLLKNPTDACLRELDDMPEVDSLDRPTEQSRELTETLELVGSVFVILMCLALALAFVVCYNMGLMNFAERVREYATLKVLGYHQNEIRRLIVGENNIISILAVLLSVYPGLLLTGVVLRVCQTESLRYPNCTAAVSVVGACLITYAFSLLIQLFLIRKVKTINMVEALKSVE